ncbi:TIGR03986 family type III CRISPR-associated RAMP protein [Vibrio sp. FJH11]
MVKPFFNPYQFIPLNSESSSMQHAQQTGNKAETARHDYWAQEAYSGRILCVLENVTPLAIAASSTQGSENEFGSNSLYISPMQTDDRAEWVSLPSTSLKGMTSANVEAISDSPLRILEDSFYSVRSQPQQALSAVGLIRRTPDGNHWQLLPLTLPSLTRNRDPKLKHWVDFFGDDYPLEHAFKCYCNEKHKDSYLSNLRQFYYKADSQLQGKTLKDLLKDNARNGSNSFLHSLKTKEKRRGREVIDRHFFILGQLMKDGYEPPKETDTVGNVRGILRCGSVKFNRNQNKYDWFIPFPESHETRSDWRDIPQNVVQQFSAAMLQSEERSKNVPLPHGYKLERDNLNRPLPIDGSLVLFNIHHGQISEISYSQVWRKTLSNTAHDLFPSSYLPERNDNLLSPAEALFGHLNKDEGLKGRITFSDGLAQSMPSLSKGVVLKKLDSPKPPSPSMYFSGATGYIAKNDLVQKKPTANGRKVYLHHEQEFEKHGYDKSANWRTRLFEQSDREQPKKNQHLKTNLINPGAKFYYTVDFENLNTAELTLLKTALDPNSALTDHELKPEEKALVKLGLGKPLGLGSAKNTIIATFFIDRQQRYSNHAFENTHRFSQFSPGDGLGDSDWPSAFPSEAKAVSETASIQWQIDDRLLNQDALQIHLAVVTLKNQDVSTPIHYPIDARGNHAEKELFKWFVNNDNRNNANRQYLKPLTKDGAETLIPNTPPPKKHR